MTIRSLLQQTLVTALYAVSTLGLVSGVGLARSSCPAGSGTTQSTHDASSDRVYLGERDTGYAPSLVAFNPARADQLLVIEDNGHMHLLDLSNPDAVHTLVLKDKVPATSAAFSPDGRRIAVGGADGIVRVIDTAQTGKTQRLDDAKGVAVTAVSFSPDGARLAAAGLNGVLHLWSGGALRHEQAIEGMPIAMLLRFSHNGSVLGVAGYSELLTVNGFGSHKKTTTAGLSAHSGPILDVNFSSEDNGVQAAGADGMVLRWPGLSSAEPGRCEIDEGLDVTAMAFSRDGGLLATGYLDGTVSIGQLREGAPKALVLHVFKDAIRSVAFSPDDRQLAIGSLDGTVRIWRLTP